MRFRQFLPVALILLITACSFVDETEHCVRTRYGKVVDQKVQSGLRSTIIWDFTCIPTTQRPYPYGKGGEEAPSVTVGAVTNDSVTVDMKIAVDYTVIDGWAAFVAKREYDRVVQEVGNAIVSGSRQAVGQLKAFQLIGEELAGAEDSLQMAIQRNVNGYIRIDRVYIRDPGIPDNITKAWGEAAVARANQQKAKDQFFTDSLNGMRTVVLARAEAEKRRLEIQAMATSPVVLELEKTKAFAAGISNALSRCTSNCIIGGDVLQRYLSINGRP